MYYSVDKNASAYQRSPSGADFAAASRNESPMSVCDRRESRCSHRCSVMLSKLVAAKKALSRHSQRAIYYTNLANTVAGAHCRFLSRSRLIKRRQKDTRITPLCFFKLYLTLLLATWCPRLLAGIMSAADHHLLLPLAIELGACPIACRSLKTGADSLILVLPSRNLSAAAEL